MNVRSLGRYEIDSELGRGSMGAVYRAHDPIIDRCVALKTVMRPDSVSALEGELYLKRFFQEARAAGKLIHPNIVVTYDASTDEATGTPFIAMELIDGESLSERLERERRIGWQQAVDWVISLALALHQAHQAGIVHRDIKPANIMITRQGVPKITDFGIAKLPAGNLTQTGVVMGTPYFMSPEQLRGEALDGRSDLFSLGGLLSSELVLAELPLELAARHHHRLGSCTGQFPTLRSGSELVTRPFSDEQRQRSRHPALWAPRGRERKPRSIPRRRLRRRRADGFPHPSPAELRARYR